MDGSTGIEREIIGILNKYADIFKRELDAQGITASGKTRDSIGVYISGGHIILGIKDGAPAATLESGRPKGKVAPVDAIYQWTIDKGFSFETDRERMGVSWYIAKRIGREGFGRPTPPHQKFGSVSATVYTPYLDDARAELEQAVRAYINNVIINTK